MPRPQDTPPSTAGSLRARWRAHGAWAGALLAWSVVAGAVALGLWFERQEQIAHAERAAASTTALLEANTARTFQIVDLALQEVTRRVQESPPPPQDPRMRAWMRSQLDGMPYVRALFVVGPDGTIQQDTDFPRTPNVSLADREYFRVHKQHPGLLTSISSPLQSRSGTGWFVAATRRIGDGPEFRGIAVAAIQLSYFSDLYRRMELDEGQQIILFHRDGRLLAIHPFDSKRIGQNFADYPLFRKHLPTQARGVYVTSGPPVPFTRIFSYDSVAGEPLVVAMGHDLRSVLAPWRRTAVVATLGLVLLLVLMLAGAALAVRERQRRRSLRERQVQGEKMEALGLLTGSIAHDFANLLAIVASNLEVVRRSNDAGAARTAVARAQRALDNGAQMTRQLLSFARARSLEVAEVDLNALLQDVLPLLEQAAGSGVQLQVSCIEGAPACRVDRAQLEVALINLVVNARDAMGGRGTIVLRTRQVARPVGGWRRRHAESMLELSVQDDGPGMSEEVRRRALEPFFTTKGEAGTGLGLAQVYGLMRQLGGEVEIRSSPGRGTAVHLLFPATGARAIAP